MLMSILAGIGFIINSCMACVLHGFGGHGHSHGPHGGHSLQEHIEQNVQPSVTITQTLESPLMPSSQGHSHSHGAHDNMNVRAAFIHIIGGKRWCFFWELTNSDIIQSLGVLVAATLIWFKPEWQILDPICTFVFSVIVFATTFRLVRESAHILMEGTPDGIDPEKVKAALLSLQGVTRLHDLHIWSIKIGRPALSVHLETQIESAQEQVLEEAQKILVTFGIRHSTIQIERSKIEV